MKENKSKKTQRTRLALIAVFLFIGIAFMVSLVTSKRQASSEESPKQYILNSGSRQNNTSSTIQEPSQSIALPSSNQLANQFIQDYISQTLDKTKLDEREDQLKSLLSSETFQAMAVENTTQQLETLLTEYQEHQQMNTNSSVRLVNRSVQNVTIYQNITQENAYYAVVSYTETPPDSSDSFTLEKTMTFTIENNQVTSFQEIPAKGADS
ncbi:hypothetical protein [Lactovum odontotermitis]